MFTEMHRSEYLKLRNFHSIKPGKNPDKTESAVFFILWVLSISEGSVFPDYLFYNNSHWCARNDRNKFFRCVRVE